VEELAGSLSLVEEPITIKLSEQKVAKVISDQAQVQPSVAGLWIVMQSDQWYSAEGGE
jgi:hypothetical protein